MSGNRKNIARKSPVKKSSKARKKVYARKYSETIAFLYESELSEIGRMIEVTRKLAASKA